MTRGQLKSYWKSDFFSLARDTRNINVQRPLGETSGITPSIVNYTNLKNYPSQLIDVKI